MSTIGDMSIFVNVRGQQPVNVQAKIKIIEKSIQLTTTGNVHSRTELYETY